MRGGRDEKGDKAAALIEAAMLDASMAILSALGIGLARAGKPSAASGASS